MLRSYLRLMLFALGLLIGVQVPGFVENYTSHVEARRLEARQGLAGFEESARRFFDGDLAALVEHYRNSQDPVFQSDAQSVQALVDRERLLEREWRAMQGPWFARVWHLLFGADRRLLDEAWAGYRFQVLLAPDAIAWGLGCALLFAWIPEVILVGLARLAGLGGRRSRRRRRVA
ncbi:DUF2937 family protein [Stutzerimonas azotifigens]|uniref:DUF2937 family protein n=1 Tax=Stutzerimonas azotifigens TaxID=291995 RepID=UPI0003FB4DAA|nr:DUF2937 family protein [Stutzerimonas azotifigens]